MKLAYVVQRSNQQGLTGSELYIQEVATAICKSATVEVFATTSKRIVQSSSSKPARGHVTYHLYPARSLGYPRFVARYMMNRFNLSLARRFVSRLDDGFYYSLLYGSTSPKLYESLMRANVEIVHSVAVPTPAAWIAWKISVRRGLPFVINPYLHLGGEENTLPFVFRMLRNASAVITPTQLERKFIVGQGVDPARVHVIPDGIVVVGRQLGNGKRFREKHEIPESDFLVLIPRKEEPKGALHTLRAVEKVRKKIHGITVVILGDAIPHVQRMVTELLSKVRDSGVRILDLGFLPAEEYRDAISACDVLVEPSCVESLGRVYQDAWLESKPVVAAFSGAIPEVVVNDLNGILVTYGDVRAIEQALLHLYESPDIRRRLGDNGNKILRERYEFYSILRKLEALYQTLIDA
jgi:glycosyltransferase involved in cell wall biosynthesis